jgi:hypothetical protein
MNNIDLIEKMRAHAQWLEYALKHLELEHHKRCAMADIPDWIEGVYIRSLNLWSIQQALRHLEARQQKALAEKEADEINRKFADEINRKFAEEISGSES